MSLYTGLSSPKRSTPPWCRVQGSGSRVQGSGCRVQGAGFRVEVRGGFEDWAVESEEAHALRVWGLELGVWGVEFENWGLGPHSGLPRDFGPVLGRHSVWFKGWGSGSGFWFMIQVLDFRVEG